MPALMPVEIVAPPPALLPPAVPRPKRSAGLIEIELQQGRRLRVGRDVDGTHCGACSMPWIAGDPAAERPLATGHTDMRKGIGGLSLLVQEVLARDPFS